MSSRNKTHANTQTEQPAPAKESKRFSKPLQALMVWVDLVAQTSVKRLFEEVGMEYTEFEEFRMKNPELVSELKQVVVLSQVLDREKSASLMRARFNEVLMAAKKPREIRDLAVAAARMPDWAFGDEMFYRAPAHFLRALAHDAHNMNTHAPAAHTHAARETMSNGVAANSRLKPDNRGGSS